MNVIYIHTHDSGRYVGPYGYQGMTPNIDRLGHDSAVFRQCYCAGPTCSRRFADRAVATLQRHVGTRPERVRAV